LRETPQFFERKNIITFAKKTVMQEFSLKINNTLTRKKEIFEPLNAPYVGMYVCGPTVYNEVHLGNCRTFTTFDIVFRYLKFLGYKVRYVRNITDVGHLVNDADAGEDKIAKQAKLEQLEPMEIVQRYTNSFHDVMKQLNNLPPSIEPVATAHIIEQIEITQSLIEKNLAYATNGSVYFDTERYHRETGKYGELSGRVTEELMAGSRDLDGQEDKKSPLDFALWKKANPEHIMRWNSPWGAGFPGWHIECTAMSTKYLGKQFDIHGGGMDLKFPHHECEVAQGTAANGISPVKYWMHANMLTVNGQRMGKSVGNAILPAELFTGNHPLLEKAFSPMTLRFCMLQTHYASTMDISNDALKAAEKAYRKLMNGLRIARELVFQETENADEKHISDILKAKEGVLRGMNDDFNSAKALASLFDLSKKLNLLHVGSLSVSALNKEAFDILADFYPTFITEVLGLREETPSPQNLLGFLLAEYQKAKEAKDYARVDALRAEAKLAGIVLKDMKNRIDWAYEE
jgi:cysteinyl-tRNA synthetase